MALWYHAVICHYLTV